ncbi:DUF2934 domain-containing protein [Steroidobacter sp.]|uniref:DUF2934 domain-containing protein n=1 Tax=Steroidobacter sp. TaxID=1978227 RepID=UPI001A568E68|nr:DUF2934 domain-containing protein [Steroidobacter sp.]MBL8267194.1 DUF2934 domain-containing protein [Steroidobacter sp.]
MEITPDTSSAKRARAKPKVVVAKEPAQTKSAAVKKPRAPRKTPTAAVLAPTPMVEAPVVAASVAAAPEDVGSMIATAAYYMAAARNFTPGYELDDWLAAERAVHAQLYG